VSSEELAVGSGEWGVGGMYHTEGYGENGGNVIKEEKSGE